MAFSSVTQMFWDIKSQPLSKDGESLVLIHNATKLEVLQEVAQPRELNDA